MGMHFDEFRSFVNIRTGEVISISSEALRNAEELEEDEITKLSDWVKDEIRLAIDIVENFDDYIGLPERYEINEYDMMERFCYSLPNKMQADVLLDAINGRGAFRRFKDKVISLGLDDQWYKFRDECYREFTIQWCNDNDIGYE